MDERRFSVALCPVDLSAPRPPGAVVSPPGGRRGLDQATFRRSPGPVPAFNSRDHRPQHSLQ